MRALPVDALPGCYLVESLASVETQLGIYRFMLGARSAVSLTGNGVSLQAFIAQNCGNVGQNGSVQYLRLFCSSVRAEGGRFQVVESTRHLLWRGPKTAALRRQLRKLTQAVKSCEADAEGRLIFEATIAYGGDLSWVRFAVSSSGQVEMVEDKRLIKLPRIVRERFEGAWQIFPPNSAASGKIVSRRLR